MSANGRSRIRNPIFVPGNRRSMLEKATGFATDAVVADLEDSVPMTEKAAARDLVADMVPALAKAGQRVMVRVNSLDTGLAEDDIAAVVHPDVFAVSVGKITSPADISDYSRLLDAAEKSAGLSVGQTRLVLWIETAAGVQHAYDIACASERIAAITFGAEDYTRDVGIRRTSSGEEVRIPRSLVALAAHGAGVTPLDTPYVNFRDSDGLESDIAEAAQLGFKGKFAIHPAQLGPIRRLFGPQPDEIEYARRVMAAWDAASAEGRGSLDLDGAMVDVPVVERARNTLAEAAELGLD